MGRRVRGLAPGGVLRAADAADCPGPTMMDLFTNSVADRRCSADAQRRATLVRLQRSIKFCCGKINSQYNFVWVSGSVV